MRIGVLHGPNLHLLGRRRPEIYGRVDLAELDRRIRDLAAELGAEATCYQSNLEGELVDWIHDGAPRFDGFLVNAAAYTHTSIALRDALEAAARPFVEVHLSNVFARESFRHHSMLSDIAVGVVTGFRAESYLLALRGLIAHLRAG